MPYTVSAVFFLMIYKMLYIVYYFMQLYSSSPGSETANMLTLHVAVFLRRFRSYNYSQEIVPERLSGESNNTRLCSEENRNQLVFIFFIIFSCLSISKRTVFPHLLIFSYLFISTGRFNFFFHIVFILSIHLNGEISFFVYIKNIRVVVGFCCC